MKSYDILVIGFGCGANVVEEALGHGLKVALVDKGPAGGTCPNLGCIPSKMLIYSADKIVEIQEARKVGVEAEPTKIDFSFIMERMRRSRADLEKQNRQSVLQVENLDFYEGVGRFVGDNTMEVNGQKIKGKKVFIASGARPLIPPIKGLETVDYLTNETLLELKTRPDSLIIIGGGYIAVEYGHFFAAMGTKVTILEMADRLVLAEEPEISALLQQELSRRMEVHTGALAEEVKRTESGVSVVVKDKKTGAPQEFAAQQILVAVGRRSNADLLNLEATGVETDVRGYIKVNEFLQTSKRNIFAVGDINGQHMFTHTANAEAQLAVHNVLHKAKEKMDYSAAPHAVFSYPQIASVGLTADNARKEHDILVGVARYSDVAYGEAMGEERGFAKAIVDKESDRLLGFHIIGPYAPILIQEVINAVAAGGHAHQIQSGLHIHPALPELILRTLGNLEEV